MSLYCIYIQSILVVSPSVVFDESDQLGSRFLKIFSRMVPHIAQPLYDDLLTGNADRQAQLFHILLERTSLPNTKEYTQPGCFCTAAHTTLRNRFARYTSLRI